MGNCGSSDDTSDQHNNNNNNNNNTKGTGRSSSPTRNGKNGRTPKNPLDSRPPGRSDSLSSIEIDADDENELALEHHKSYHELQSAFQKKMETGLSTNSHSTNSPSPIDEGSFFNSSSLHSRSSGTGNTLVGGDLGKQREEASVNLGDEFFVWDDMKYDLRKDRESRPSTKGGGNTWKNRRNTVTTNVADLEAEENQKNNNNNGAASPTTGGKKPTGGATAKKVKQSAFVFNDFAVDEFDFEDDDDDETSGLSFFSAAAVALASSPNNNNNTSGDLTSPTTLSGGRRRSSGGMESAETIAHKMEMSGGSSGVRLNTEQVQQQQQQQQNSSNFTSQSTSNNSSFSNNNNSNNNNGANSPLISRQISTTQFESASGSSPSTSSPTSTTTSTSTTASKSRFISLQTNSNDFQSPPNNPKPSTDNNFNGEISPFSIANPTSELRKLGGDSEDLRNVSFTTLAGHTTRVKVLAVAPGEREYVSCSSDDFNLTYADLATGKELGAFIGHTENVLHATFSHCGKYLSSTSRDNTMMLWDVVTQKAMLTFEHAKVVICSVFSRDSRFIATGCQDKVCRLWEARKGRELGSFAQHEGIIIAMAFAPDNTYVISASSDRKLLKWSGVPSREQAVAALAAKAKGEKVPPPQVGKPLGAMLGHEGIILSCTFTSDGKYIISNDERLVKVWNAETCECYKTFHVDRTVPLRNLPESKKLTWTLAAAAPGCFPKHFMVAANNRFLYVFNIHTEKEEVNLYCKSPIYCLTAGQRSTALCGDAFGNVYCARLGNPYLTLEPPSASTRPATPAMNIS